MVLGQKKNSETCSITEKWVACETQDVPVGVPWVPGDITLGQGASFACFRRHSAIFTVPSPLSAWEGHLSAWVWWHHFNLDFNLWMEP